MKQTTTHPTAPFDKPSKPENVKPEEDELKRFTGVVAEPVVVEAENMKQAETLAREQIYDNHKKIRMNIRRGDE